MAKKIYLTPARGDPRYVYCYLIYVYSYLAVEIEVCADTKAQSRKNLTRFLDKNDTKYIARCRWYDRASGEWDDLFDGITPNPKDLKGKEVTYRYREDF